MRRAILIGGVLLMGLALAGFSCEKGLRFSHQQHVDKQGLECKECHAGSEDGLRAGAPDPKYCLNCHEEADQKYGWAARQLAASWPRLQALPADGKFSHKKHQDAGMTCDKCHGDMKSNRKVTAANLPTMETCVKCHREQGVGTACAVCHQTLSEKSPPPDHARDWKRYHGAASQEPGRGSRCFMCHERSYCSTCHAIEKPQDHSHTWVNFGHGVAAGMDRSRCATCHQSDFCIQCHTESQPISHQPGWGSPLDRHCLNCHLTVTVSNCSVCHGGRVAHLNAPARPNTPPHTTPTDCRGCHHGALLPHPDNGDNCQICHKRG